MTIIRGKRPESSFYTVSKTISEDRALSWKARGLLIYLLGKPDHWKIIIQDLINQTGDSTSPTGRDGVYSILNELLGAGYLTRSNRRDESGTFVGSEYFVQEKPLTPNPEADIPLAADTTLVKKETASRIEATAKNEVKPHSRKAKSGNKVTLTQYLSANPDANWGPEDGKARKHLRESKMPEEWFLLALRWFRDRYADSTDHKYTNWPAAFANAVVDNWGKLWYFDQKTSAWALTSQGMAYKIKVDGGAQ